jgi:hypothetical protein
VVKLPEYALIFGQKQWLSRWNNFLQLVASPDWPHKEGTLDFRYPDGVAYKPAPGNEKPSK